MTPRRVLLGWLVLLVIGFSNGVVRQLGFARVLSEPAARHLSAASFVVLQAIAIHLLTRRWPLASPAHAWRVGASWLVLTFLFETGMGVVAGRSWSEIFADYALWEGKLWPLLLLFILVAPRLALAVHARR